MTAAPRVLRPEDRRAQSEHDTSKNILVLDDDASLRELLTIVFAEKGWRVHQARRIAEARQILERHRVDIALLDGVLPDGSGVDFIKELVEQETPVQMVFMSAFYRDMKTRRDLLAAKGVRAILQKPLRPAEVACQIEALLAAQSDTAEAPERDASNGTDVRSMLAELHIAYATKLQQQLESLDKQIRDGRGSPMTSAAATGALAAAHKIRGTAGTFDFPIVGELVGVIEESLRTAAESGEAPEEGLWQQCAAQLHRARRQRDQQTQASTQNRDLAPHEGKRSGDGNQEGLGGRR